METKTASAFSEKNGLVDTEKADLLSSQFKQERIFRFKLGETIYNFGDQLDYIYLIEKGKVKISRSAPEESGSIKELLGVGSLFGEMALFDAGSREEKAEALDDETTIIGVKPEELNDANNFNPALSQRILSLIGKNIKRAERRVEALLFMDARSRIVNFLREMALDHGEKVGFETMIRNHFTHQDIASMTGTSRQTVTTTLNQLKEKNIINFDRRRILIRDMDLLE